MRYGRSVEDGWLPVFSVSTMEEANDLLVLACETNVNGEFVARELVMEQTLENLEVFSTRLDERHDVLVEHGRCSCARLPWTLKRDLREDSKKLVARSNNSMADLMRAKKRLEDAVGQLPPEKVEEFRHRLDALVTRRKDLNARAKELIEPLVGPRKHRRKK